MRTNIVIDDELMAEAMTLTGIKTKREVVHEALTVLIEQRKQTDALAGLRALRGKLTFWEDVIEDLEAHRIVQPDDYIAPVRALGEEKAEYRVENEADSSREKQ